MGLQIKHNRAEHTHENEQFRRIAKSLILLFKNKNWKSNFLCNLGYGDEDQTRPRAPRYEFEEIVEIL